MNVMHVITGLGTGGAETVLCRLLESLRPPAFEHTVVSLGGAGDLDARVCEAGARLLQLNMHPGRPNPLVLLRLRRLLRASKPEVIHAWMYHANLMATLAACGVGVPILWGIRQSLYGLRRERRGTRLVIRAGRMLSGRATQIIYNSAASATQHEAFGFRPKHRLIIPNGFDVEQFRSDDGARARVRAELSIGAGELAIGLVARWHPMKDHANFLRAAVRLRRSQPQAVFVLVGTGLDADNKQLMAMLQSLGLSDRVRLCGRRDDVSAIDAALDIASSSSSWGEAFPNAIGEAMACGVPCVATDVGDVRDIIGDTGIVVPPRDPAALCRGWETLLEMGEAGRRALGARARQRIVERYSLATMAGRYAALYADVARNH